MRIGVGQRDTAPFSPSSEVVLRKIMGHAPVGMCLVSPEGSFLTVNRALCDLLARPEATLLRSTWQELTHPDDLNIDLAHVQRLLDGTADHYRLTKRFLHPDGTIVWGDLSVSCVRDAEGDVEFFISQIADISESMRRAAQLARSEEIMRKTMANAPVGMCLVSPEGSFLTVNRALCDLLARPEGALLRSTWQELTHPDDLNIDLAHVQRLLDGTADHYRLTKRFLHPDGTIVWGDLSVSCVRDAEGDVEFFISQIADITSAKQREAEAQRSLLHYRSIAENSTDVVMHVDPEGTISWISPNSEVLLGAAASQLIDTPFIDLIDPGHRARISEKVNQLHRTRQSAREEVPMLRRDGAQVWVDIAGSPMTDSAGKYLGRIARLRDVSEQVERLQDLQYRANYDPLTGLLGRDAGMRRIQEQLDSGRPALVAFIDVDDFKDINDSYGHDAGDALLTAVAERISGWLREGDVVARIGGDEFIALIENPISTEHGLTLLENLLRYVHQPLLLPGILAHPRLSIGVAASTPGQSLDEVLARADDAMYEAKRSGGYAVRLAPEHYRAPGNPSA